MFDVINDHPRLALTALLAIDQDPEYLDLYPSWDETRVDYEEGLAEGDIPLGIDVEALHLFVLDGGPAWPSTGRVRPDKSALMSESCTTACGTRFQMRFTP